MMDRMGSQEWDPQFVWDEVFRPAETRDEEGNTQPRAPGRVETAVRLDLSRLVRQDQLKGVEPSLVALAISLAFRVDEGDSVYSTAKELRTILEVLHTDSGLPAKKVNTPDDDDLSSPD